MRKPQFSSLKNKKHDIDMSVLLENTPLGTRVAYFPYPHYASEDIDDFTDIKFFS